MPRVYITERARKHDAMERRMDRFDSVVTEYLRSTGFTTADLAYELGIDVSTLWRYRNRVHSFELAPFSTITKVCQLAKCTTETLRFICGMDSVLRNSKWQN